ncbi:MAG: hypothetical protein IPJ34_34025 [Myxococcales bacterium]|nr:hypothetical protein [Myxococcales bacterium]
MNHPALWVVLLVSTLVACRGSTPPPVTQAETPAAVPATKTAVRGRIDGIEVQPTQAVFLWRPKADDLSIVFADSDDLCAALQAGAMPKNATVMSVTIKHNTKENRDAPFAAGDFPVRQGSALEPQDTKRARLAKLDATCKPTTTATATSGSVHLTTTEVKVGGVAEGSLSLVFPSGEKLEGPFRATYCAPPDLEPNGCR